MEPHVARHRISRNPNREVAFTGKYDQNGEPVYRSMAEKILPGSVFIPTDEEERGYFTSLDAARPLSDDEKALYESGVHTSFPADPGVDPLPYRSRG